MQKFRTHIGWRTVKTAGTAALVAFVYYLIGRNPAFASIGVMFGMGTTAQDSIKNGGNRLFGTIIGGSIGILMYWLYLLAFPEGGHNMYLPIYLYIGIVLLVLICQNFWPGGVQPGGVVLCLLLFSTPTDTYVTYALNRMFDTAIGVLAAWLVNYLLPKERMDAVWHGIQDMLGIERDPDN